MPEFKISSGFGPAGDQTQAIRKLSQGIETGLQEQTLLGVTGSGKTFTMQGLNMFNKSQEANLTYCTQQNSSSTISYRI